MKILEIDIHAEKTSENLLELARTASSRPMNLSFKIEAPRFLKSGGYYSLIPTNILASRIMVKFVLSAGW